MRLIGFRARELADEGQGQRRVLRFQPIQIVFVDQPNVAVFAFTQVSCFLIYPTRVKRVVGRHVERKRSKQIVGGEVLAGQDWVTPGRIVQFYTGELTLIALGLTAQARPVCFFSLQIPRGSGGSAPSRSDRASDPKPCQQSSVCSRSQVVRCCA